MITLDLFNNEGFYFSADLIKLKLTVKPGADLGFSRGRGEFSKNCRKVLSSVDQKLSPPPPELYKDHIFAQNFSAAGKT